MGIRFVLMAAMGFISCMYVMIFSNLLLLLPETNRAAHIGPILSVSESSNEGSSLLLALE
ncbi:hypothetical protein PsorP6_012260 [Peronosclerospora sorghi]|uniref:Uncharacterized protein n=1 Tax=Peronosclerospora sorghi TaxID=230839 RepID=A0ACC0WIA1_9STRA|nr:hypothetical protein PsorP6_012260 [Peronosclerospora sorghi]